jgi:hypothetical protein
VVENKIGRRAEEGKMPIMIGLVAGLMNGLGIGLLSKGMTVLGVGWFAMGFAVAFALYMRVREEQKVAVKSVVYRDETHPDIKSHIVK